MCIPFGGREARKDLLQGAQRRVSDRGQQAAVAASRHATQRHALLPTPAGDHPPGGAALGRCGALRAALTGRGQHLCVCAVEGSQAHTRAAPPKPPAGPPGRAPHIHLWGAEPGHRRRTCASASAAPALPCSPACMLCARAGDAGGLSLATPLLGAALVKYSGMHAAHPSTVCKRCMRVWVQRRGPASHAARPSPPCHLAQFSLEFTTQWNYTGLAEEERAAAEELYQRWAAPAWRRQRGGCALAATLPAPCTAPGRRCCLRPARAGRALPCLLILAWADCRLARWGGPPAALH